MTGMWYNTRKEEKTETGEGKMEGKKRILTVILPVLLSLMMYVALPAACAEDWEEQLAGMMDPYDSVYLTVNWENMKSKNCRHRSIKHHSSKMLRQ